MPILIVWALLIVFWIFAIYSVSIFSSFQLTLHQFHDPSNYFYFFRQIEHLFIALILAGIIYYVPLDFIKKNRWKFFLWTLFFLLLVFTPLWLKLKWARWWLHFPGLWSVQPWDFVKLAFIIFFSGWLVKKNKILWSLEWYISMLIVVWVSTFLFLLIPDLGTLLVLWPVALILYTFAWWKIKYVAVSLVLWLIFTFTVWMQFHYIKKRFDYFLNPSIDKTEQWIGYQTQQWLIWIWAGWFIWKWYGKWLQKFGFIPEAQSDFIFAAFSEEIWFLWNTILFALYFVLAYFAIKKLPYVRDKYYQYLSVWILSLILWQVFINVWVNVKIIPLTWLTLPFVSYGGTALMVNVIEITLLYKILYKQN